MDYIELHEDLYKLCSTCEWSKKVNQRRFSWFGHLARLPEFSPAKQALYEALKPTLRPLNSVKQ